MENRILGASFHKGLPAHVSATDSPCLLANTQQQMKSCSAVQPTPADEPYAPMSLPPNSLVSTPQQTDLAAFSAKVSNTVSRCLGIYYHYYAHCVYSYNIFYYRY